MKITIIMCFVILLFPGSHAQVASIIDDSTVYHDPVNHFFRIKPTGLVIPVTLFALGVAARENIVFKNIDHQINSELQEDYPDFCHRIDNYLQFIPAATVFTLQKLGYKGQHNIRDQTLIFGISTLTTSVIVCVLKSNIDSWRPDVSSNSTFPSGHTATAFASAEFLHQEYKGNHLLTAGGYIIAAGTGTLRLYNHKHYFSDIVAGAGIGILSTKLAYMIFPVVKKHLFKRSLHKRIVEEHEL